MNQQPEPYIDPPEEIVGYLQKIQSHELLSEQGNDVFNVVTVSYVKRSSVFGLIKKLKLRVCSHVVSTLGRCCSGPFWPYSGCKIASSIRMSRFFDTEVRLFMLEKIWNVIPRENSSSLAWKDSLCSRFENYRSFSNFTINYYSFYDS